MTTQATTNRTALTARIIEEPGRFTLVVVDGERCRTHGSLCRLVLTVERGRPGEATRVRGTGVHVPASTINKAGRSLARLIARSDDHPETMEWLASIARSKASYVDFVAAL